MAARTLGLVLESLDWFKKTQTSCAQSDWKIVRCWQSSASQRRPMSSTPPMVCFR